MRDLELETPRHHTFDPALIAGLAQPWPRWPVDGEPRPFDREAAVALAARMGKRFWTRLDELDELDEVLPERDGAVTREEAAFWASLLLAQDIDDSKLWSQKRVRERSRILGKDSSADELLEVLRGAKLRRQHWRAWMYLARALRVLLPWSTLYAFVLDTIPYERGEGTLRHIGWCPAGEREAALAIARSHSDQVPEDRWTSSSVFRLYQSLPDPEVTALALTSARGGWEYERSVCSLALLAEDGEAVDRFAATQRFLWEPRHVALRMARRGFDGLDAWLDVMLALKKKPTTTPTLEVLAALGRVRAPEVIARIYPHVDARGERGDVAQAIIDEAVSEHAAHGLLTYCKRAGTKRTWAIAQLRRLLERADGRAAIERALGAQREGVAAFARAEVLEREVVHAKREDAPEWAASLLAAADDGEVPSWVTADELPELVDAETGRALPRACSVGLLVLDDAMDTRDRVEPALERLTRESVTRLVGAMMRQWFYATSVTPGPIKLLAMRAMKLTTALDYLEYGRPMEWVARFPTPSGVALLEGYASAKGSPHFHGYVRDRAIDLLGEIDSPEALGAAARVASQSRYEDTRTRAVKAFTRGRRRLKLSEEEARDYAVSSFGLNARGARDFDYGARVIRMKVESGELVFEDLVSGKVYANAPRGLKSDDVDQVTAARAIFDVTVKPLRAELQLQRARLESAMLGARRWRAPWWTQGVLGHPILGPLARGLVWEVRRERELVALARPTEDGGLIDAGMDDVALEDGDTLSLAHPLHMPQESLRGWVEHMLGFEVVQPFDQIARATSSPEAALDLIRSAARSRVGFEQRTLRALARGLMGSYSNASVRANGVLVFAIGPKDSISVIFTSSSSNESPQLAWMRIGDETLSCAELEPTAPLGPLAWSELARIVTRASTQA